ncbi:MAG: branched-chain amino acid ABC transporter permease [Fimbriimonadaceae bacterium]|nr:branched-chain amino acid ABC transporter permease [Alphaproteobacteria bacterium]
MLTNPVFLFIQVMNSLALGMNLFIIAAGLTLIFGILRIINFAHGSFFMFGAYAILTTTQYFGSGSAAFWGGILVAGVALAAIAYLIEFLFLRHLYDKEHILQLLFTFALVLIFGDIAKIIWGTEQHSVSYPSELAGAVNLGISYYPSYLLFLTTLGPCIAIIMWLVIDKTRWGRIVRAARQDREMLSALGINVKRLFSVVFIVGAALAGIGGALAAPRIAVEPGMDATIIIECFIIIIIGGLGSLWGSFLGAVILGFVSVFSTVFIGEWDVVMIYIMMVVILLWRPWGLLGKSEEERH